MKFLKIIFTTIIFITSYSSLANAKIKIVTWDENIKLTKTGKTSEVKIEGKVSGLKKGYYHDYYSFVFDPKQHVKINKVIFGNQIAKYSFTNNRLKINFNKNKSNGDRVTIYFAYKETYEKIYEFLRQELIHVPAFASGAHARVYIGFPWKYESATLNKKVAKIGNGYRYNGVVPKNGVNELIKLTLSSNSWDVVMKDDVISSDGGIGDAQLLTPKYFQDSGQRIARNVKKSSPRASSKTTKGNFDVFGYSKLKSDKINVVTKARIYTGRHNRVRITRDPTKHLAISAKQKALLTPILNQIKKDPKYRGLPLYAKIGKYTHDFIKYDRKYIGKLLTIEEILRSGSGVCVEYAQMFNSLSRLANIPSLVAYGAAYGEYDKFEGHAWNLIYYRKKWIYVDPTWNLMSGIVSSSHIYFNDESAKSIEVQYYKDQGLIRAKKDFEITRFR